VMIDLASSTHYPPEQFTHRHGSTSCSIFLYTNDLEMRDITLVSIQYFLLKQENGNKSGIIPGLKMIR
jgi:hypothetical protein